MATCCHCGFEDQSGDARFCSNCGNASETTNNSEQVNTTVTAVKPEGKSKMAAGLLGIFLGQWGVHNFYLGYTGKAVAQLLLSIFGYILLFVVVGFFMVAAAGIWGLIEGIMILSGSINTDANGNPLRD